MSRVVSNDLQAIVADLINRNREGNYWDFKEFPHDNNGSLVHDIISLANAIHSGDRYLIFGVTDPAPTCEIKGLDESTPNRKKQNNIIDVLRTASFAGEIRPELELRTIQIDARDIDVLVVFDTPHKPFYLINDYPKNAANRRVRANHIYTRINDTNTPIDKSADINLVEKMWRERFGLDLSPVQRMTLLLTTPSDWFKNIGNKNYAYHKLHAEYNITFGEPRELMEPYSFFFPNERSFFGTAVFRYHSTVLFELEYLYCDEMRHHLVVPNTRQLKVDSQTNWYYYFDLNENDGKFLLFMTDRLHHLSSRGSTAPFLLFKDKQERLSFERFVVDNQERFASLIPSFMAQDAMKRMKQRNFNSAIDASFLSRIEQMYEQWKSVWL
jgi:hypothetical protein